MTPPKIELNYSATGAAAIYLNDCLLCSGDGSEQELLAEHLARVKETALAVSWSRGVYDVGQFPAVIERQ